MRETCRSAATVPKVLSPLGLTNNQIGAAGAERLAGVLPQCPTLSPLELGYSELGYNGIGDEGAGRLAGVLPQCPPLSHVHLHFNGSEMREQAGLLGCCNSAQRCLSCIFGGNQM